MASLQILVNSAACASLRLVLLHANAGSAKHGDERPRLSFVIDVQTASRWHVPPYEFGSNLVSTALKLRTGMRAAYGKKEKAQLVFDEEGEKKAKMVGIQMK